MNQLTITKAEKPHHVIDTSGWTTGENLVRLDYFWYLWKGEERINFHLKKGVMWINDLPVGVDLSSDAAVDKHKVITVLTNGSSLANLKQYPNVDTVVTSDVIRSEDLRVFNSMPDIRALSFEDSVIEDPNPSIEIIGRMNNLRALNLGRTGITDHHLPYISSMNQLIYLDLSQNHVTDSGLEHLGVLTKLKTLILGNTRITNKGLASIKGLTKLKTLRLDRVGIDNKGLDTITGFSELRYLDLTGTDVTDNGLKKIAKLSKLRHLDLAGTTVTNSGLRHIRYMADLRFLDLDRTFCSTKGKESLTKYLTNCKIIGQSRQLLRGF